MRSSLFVAFALGLGACSAQSLPDLEASGPESPTAAHVPMPYQPVMAGTGVYGPVELKPWRELNDSVAPGGTR